MLAIKVDKKKMVQYGVILLIVFGAIGYLIYTNFLSTGKDTAPKNTTPGTSAQTTKTKEIINFDDKILDEKSYKTLKEYKYEPTDYDDIKTGKKNPFIYDEKGTDKNKESASGQSQ